MFGGRCTSLPHCEVIPGCTRRWNDSGEYYNAYQFSLLVMVHFLSFQLWEYGAVLLLATWCMLVNQITAALRFRSVCAVN